MCTHSGKSPDTSPSFADILDLVLEDRAEFIPFTSVGRAADVATARSLALAGWRVQIALIARNSPDPVLKVAAAQALRNSDVSSIRQLIHLAQGSPCERGISDALSQLAIAHLNLIFGDR